MANVLTSGQGTPRTQIGLAARGLIAETFPLFHPTAAATLATQVVYGGLIGLRAGDVITNLLLAVQVAASGTSPTLARLGLADSTGKMVAITANVNSAAGFTLTLPQFALSSTYIVPNDGGYYVCALINGTFGTTDPTFGRLTNLNKLPGAVAGFPPLTFQWTGQTDLPAVGASLTMSTIANGQVYYMAVN